MRGLWYRLKTLGAGNAFAANVMRMLAGTASAQLLTLLAYPVLTRLYPPHDFGVQAAMESALIILVPMMALRLEMALPIARSEREAGSLLALCGLVMVATTLLMTAAVAAVPQAWFSERPELWRYRWFLPLGLFAFGSYTVMSYEGTRQNRFGDVARTRVVQAVTGPVVQISLGVMGAGALGLMVGYVLSQSSGTVGLVRKLVLGAQSPLQGVTWQSMRAAAFHHRHFAIFSSWTTALSNAANFVLTVAFSVIYGPAVAGLMFLGERVLMKPLYLITTAVLPVYTRELALALETDPARVPALFKSVVKKQALLACLWILPLVLAAPYLVPRVFGAEWAGSADYLLVMAIGFLPTSMVHPVLSTLQVMREQRLAAILDVGRSLAIFSTIGVVAATGMEPLNGALLCSLTQAVCQIGVIGVIWNVVNRQFGIKRPD